MFKNIKNVQKLKNLILNSKSKFDLKLDSYDNKNMSKFFSDKYLNFLQVYKYSPIKSKFDLLKLLNRRPKTNLKGVQRFKSNLQNLSNRIKNKKQIDIKNLIKANKINFKTKDNLETNKNILNNNNNKDNKINKNNNYNVFNLTNSIKIKENNTTQKNSNNIKNIKNIQNIKNIKNNENIKNIQNINNIKNIQENKNIKNNNNQILAKKLESKLINNNQLNININKNQNKLNKMKQKIKVKINLIKKSLKNNKLPFPIYLLEPLLTKINNNNNKKFITNKLNKNLNKFNLNKFNNINNINVSNNLINNNNYNFNNNNFNFFNTNNNMNNIFNTNSIFDEDTKNNFKAFIKNNQISKDYSNYLSKINKFKNLINKYNLNKKISTNKFKPLTITKYFQFLTKYKFINKYEQNIRYNFFKYNNIKIDDVVNLLEIAFRSMSCLISKPVFIETPQKLVINLFYFYIQGQVNIKKRALRLKNQVKEKNINNNLNKLNSDIINSNSNNINKVNKDTQFNLKNKRNQWIKAKLDKQKNTFKVLFSPKNLDKLNKLCIILNRIFKKKVEFDIIPFKVPFFDERILVQAIAIICNKVTVSTFFKFVFRKIKLVSKYKALFKYKFSISKSFLTGLKIHIGGRLLTQRVIPRKTTRSMQRGAISHRKAAYVDWSRVVLKNRRGAHNITVTMSHVI